MTKKEQLDYFKKRLNIIGLCPSLKKHHTYFYNELMDLFKNHPEYPKKIENVIDIAIERNKQNPSFYEYKIIKSNGDTDNISYRCCINKPCKDNNLKNAMRYAVENQILEFRNNCNILECEFCKSRQNIHIDHIKPFKELYDDFLKDRNDIPSIFDDNYYNSAKFQEIDEDFENEWSEYHKNNATLRCLCRKCNTGRNKK